MNHFPITIVDDFYDHPDDVRNYALSLDYEKSSTGDWPGERSELLSNINEKLFTEFGKKILSLFFDLDEVELECDINTGFQKIHSLSKDENDIRNQGWIHLDDESFLSGVIYLNPDPKQNWGTSIYNLKKGKIDNSTQNTKFLHYSNSSLFDITEYEKEKQEYNNKFIETIKIENVYNRLIIFEKGVYHGVPNYYSDDDCRLTQVFFIPKLKCSKKSPILRSKTCQ